MMDKEIYDKIKEKIAKEHHLIIDEKDPIFAILTANEIVLSEYVNKLDQVISINLLNLENQYEKIIKESKELAENRISIAIEKTKEDLQNTRNNILKDIKDSLPKDIEIKGTAPKEKNKFNILYLIITAVVFLLIGLNIGILI